MRPQPYPESKRLLLVGAWGCFTAALLFVVRYHEPWFDEAQAWLIARDSSPFDILFRRMRYEGTPALWHFILWGLIKVKLPYSAANYVSVMLASLAAGIFLRFAPFPPTLRVLFIFGYFPAYQYSIVARSYVLNVLLVIIAATLYPHRLSRAWRYCLVLAALANANAYGFIFAAIVFGEFFWSVWQRRTMRQFVAPALMFLAGAGFAVVQAAPAPDVSFAAPRSSSPVIAVLSSLVQPTLAFIQLGSSSFLLPFGILLSIVAVAVTAHLAWKAGHLGLVIALCGAPIFFGALKYRSVWHAGMIYVSWIFVMWQSWPTVSKLSLVTRRLVVVTLTIVFLFQCYDALAAWRLDLRTPYSAGPQAAIQLHHYIDSRPDPKLACMGFKVFAIQPYFDHNVCDNYFAGSPKRSYYDWNRKQPYPPLPDISYLDRLMQTKTYDFFLVSDTSITLSQAELVAHAEGYCLSDRFVGHLIWKDHFLENDGLMLFRRCADVTGAAPVFTGDITGGNTTCAVAVDILGGERVGQHRGGQWIKR